MYIYTYIHIYIYIGCILCDESFPIPMASVFLAQAQIFQKKKERKNK